MLLPGLLFTGCAKKTAAAGGPATGGQRQPVEVVQVARRDMVESLSLVGSLAPNETAQIRAEISGQVRDVLFDEGQRVTRGQVLLRIDDAELRAQLAQAEARFHLAELNLKRSEDLTQARSMSQAEADRMRSDHASAEAELQLLRVRLAKMEIKAPFDGIAGARTVSPGDYATGSTPITTIDDLTRLKVDFQVPERFTDRIRPGSAFTMRAQTPAGEIRTAGEVYFISSVIDRTTRSSQVKGYLATETSGLKPGMFANIDIVLQVRGGVLAVPEGAILTTPAGPQVVVVQDKDGGKVADFVGVQLGLRETGLVEVAPLKPGALTEQHQIVASGVGALVLYPGVKLEPRPLRPEFRIGN
ncbi:Cobalt-zinc-cadmium resistance protein CzcB [Lacunisphaera limnophila]|uniref:Cobalt-zinc-cadmium resistance protein CzcB n=1 Tax=Lacunisphaera limnophila TaxID=1838286 RepID=A0A1D8AXG5_9BACT|nr:Cobalt-zinc-cadmium resistance protein CzcB [Lacunisphaera limnophila]